MYHIDSPRSTTVAAAQLASGIYERGAAGGELVQLNLRVAQPAQRVHLVAHEATALGVAGVGKHVGHDQRPHSRDRSAPRRSERSEMMRRMAYRSTDNRTRCIWVLDTMVLR
jgi:hypothetical protein